MAEQHCIYPDREGVIVAYLYDDIDAVHRVAFETHVTTCEPCRTELADLRGVRSTLAQWAAPEARQSHRQSPVVSHQPGWWHAVPVWAQLAAAMLVLGVSASIANLDVRYDRAKGLSVTTGWSKASSAQPPAVAPQTQASVAPWRADLAAMQKQIHEEMRAQSATLAATSTPPPAPAMSDADFSRRVRLLLDASDEAQRQDFASKLVQLQKDVYAQQQADLAKLYKAMGVFQTTTRGELASQRQVLSLAVSQQR
jgi:hypothetical protein